MASALQKRKKELMTELTQIEKQIYELETNYLEESREFGNIFTGWTKYVSGEILPKPKKQVTNEERLFSLSSVTSPASKREEKMKSKGSTDGIDQSGKKRRKGGSRITGGVVINSDATQADSVSATS